MWENWKCVRVKGWKIVFNVFMNNKNYVTLTFHTPVWYVQWYIYYIYVLQQGHLYWQGFSPLKVD